MDGRTSRTDHWPIHNCILSQWDGRDSTFSNRMVVTRGEVGGAATPALFERGLICALLLTAFWFLSPNPLSLLTVIYPNWRSLAEYTYQNTSWFFLFHSNIKFLKQMGRRLLRLTLQTSKNIDEARPGRDNSSSILRKWFLSPRRGPNPQPSDDW